MSRYKLEQPEANQVSDWVDRTIKWTSELEAHLSNGDILKFDRRRITTGLFRPFVAKQCYYSPIVTHRRYQMPQIFPHDISSNNQIISFCVNHRDFYVLAADRVVDLHFTGDTQCLPLYRYTDTGERVSNITEWGLRQFREHYGDESITAEDIFAYTYAALHDPAYRQKYELDLRREFPRLPFREDFAAWVRLGQELLDLHIGFEDAEPFALQRVDKDGAAGKATLKADKANGTIVLDGQTTLAGVPAKAWEYRLGSRSALEWVLDQYKERMPRDPTIRARFNNYHFLDHKERVIDLLQRVCTVSVETVRIVNRLNLLTSIEPKDAMYFT